MINKNRSISKDRTIGISIRVYRVPIRLCLSSYVAQRVKSGLVTEILMSLIDRVEYRSRRCYVIHERFVVPVDIGDLHGPPDATSSWLMEASAQTRYIRFERHPTIITKRSLTSNSFNNIVRLKYSSCNIWLYFSINPMYFLILYFG